MITKIITLRYKNIIVFLVIIALITRIHIVQLNSAFFINLQNLYIYYTYIQRRTHIPSLVGIFY